LAHAVTSKGASLSEIGLQFTTPSRGRSGHPCSRRIFWRRASGVGRIVRSTKGGGLRRLPIVLDDPVVDRDAVDQQTLRIVLGAMRLDDEGIFTILALEPSLEVHELVVVAREVNVVGSHLEFRAVELERDPRIRVSSFVAGSDGCRMWMPRPFMRAWASSPTYSVLYLVYAHAHPDCTMPALRLRPLA
jgi:hypothetical protein